MPGGSTCDRARSVLAWMPLRGRQVTASAVLLASVVIGVGACLQGTIGFGLGIFAAPLLAIFEPSLVPGPLILVGSMLTLIVLIKERVSLDLRGTGWAIAGRLPGSLLGSVIVLLLPRTFLALFLAGVVLLGAATTACGWIPRASPRNLLIAGATSGVMGTATSVGSPPMALVWQSSEVPVMRASMSGFLLVGSLASIVSLALLGVLDGRSVRDAVLLVPAVVAGYLASLFLVGRVHRRGLRRAVIVLSTLSACVLACQQIF